MTEKERHTVGKGLALMAALAYERPKRFDALLKEKEGDTAFFTCVDSEENEVRSSQDFFVEGTEDVDLKPMEAFLVRKDERVSHLCYYLKHVNLYSHCIVLNDRSDVTITRLI